VWLSQSGLTVDPVPPAPAHLTLENLIRAIRDLAYHDPEHTEKESSSRSCWSGDRLSRAWGRPVTAAEIAEELGESKRHVAEALSLQGCFAATSLDTPVARWVISSPRAGPATRRPPRPG